jgi:hypothetical protein
MFVRCRVLAPDLKLVKCFCYLHISICAPYFWQGEMWECQISLFFGPHVFLLQRLHGVGLQRPDQVADPNEQRFTFTFFKNDNLLVNDAEKQLEDEEHNKRPWSADEKRIFMDKFLAYPKVLLWH